MSRNSFDILIVDDDPEVARLLRMVLESRRYPCRVAYGGAQGLSRFAAEPPSLLITDLHMNSGDGRTLIQSARRIRDVPVIVVSGFAQEMERVGKMRNVRVIAKPVEITALMREVRACRSEVGGWGNGCAV